MYNKSNCLVVYYEYKKLHVGPVHNNEMNIKNLVHTKETNVFC